MKAFLFASLVAGISTGVVLEYRRANPFGLYSECDIDALSCYNKSSLNLQAILHTSFVSFSSTFLVLWILHILFGFGRSHIRSDGDIGGSGVSS